MLIEDGRIAPFSESETTHVAMGRFGNVMLVGGEPDLSLGVKRGELVRFYFTNTANTRVFNVALPGARMKLVGADSGHYEHEELVEEALLAPSERVVLDVLFDQPGELALEHRTPEKSYRLVSIGIADERAEPDLRDDFENVRTNPDMQVVRERAAPWFEAPPDKTLSFIAEMDQVGPEGGVDTGRLRLSNALGGCLLVGGQVPGVRDEADARRGRNRASNCLRLPHACRHRGCVGGLLPEVRNDATANRKR